MYCHNLLHSGCATKRMAFKSNHGIACTHFACSTTNTILISFFSLLHFFPDLSKCTATKRKCRRQATEWRVKCKRDKTIRRLTKTKRAQPQHLRMASVQCAPCSRDACVSLMPAYHFSLHKVCEECRFHFHVFKSYPHAHTHFLFKELNTKKLRGKRNTESKKAEEEKEGSWKEGKGHDLAPAFAWKDTSWSKYIP